MDSTAFKFKPVSEILRTLANQLREELGIKKEEVITHELDLSTPEKFDNFLIQVKQNMSQSDPQKVLEVLKKCREIHEQALENKLANRIMDAIKSLVHGLSPKVQSLIKGILPQAVTNPELLNKLIKELATVHSPVREASSLTDDLLKVYNFFDEETPEVIKSVVNRIIRTDPTGEKLEKDHDIVKSEIKKLKNPLRRELLQYLVLMPIQEKLGRINPVTVDRAKKSQLFNNLKRLKFDKETQQRYTETSMEEGLSKGAPSKQIKHLSEEIHKLAHLLISNLH